MLHIQKVKDVWKFVWKKGNVLVFFYLYKLKCMIFYWGSQDVRSKATVKLFNNQFLTQSYSTAMGSGV